MKPRRAVTLLEVVLAISVIAILLAILLPAVVAARSSASTTQCKNRLRQLGLAQQSHYETAGIYAMGNDWHYALLPYLDEAATYDAIVPIQNLDERLHRGETVVGHPVPAGRLDVFECPDEIYEQGYYFSNYTLNFGPFGYVSGLYKPPTGQNQSRFDGFSADPVYTTDGLSMTAMLSELAIDPSEGPGFSESLQKIDGVWSVGKLYDLNDDVNAFFHEAVSEPLG